MSKHQDFIPNGPRHSMQSMGQVLTKPTSKRRFDRRFYVTIGLAVLIVTPLSVYYSISYNSVHGTIVQFISATRKLDQGPLVSTLTFRVEAHVWSWGASIDTRVSSPIFNFLVDGYSLPIPAYGGSATFQPGSFTAYHLTFTTADNDALQAIGKTMSSTVRISMDGIVNAGLYSEQRTSTDSSTLTW